jgi:gamma-glutamylcyclotransferase (GGCT)/AIG2-like uncharacterized protein YtfP
MIWILSQRLTQFTLMKAVRLRKTFSDPLPEPNLFLFSYGANLNPMRFEKYEMNAVPIGVARLSGFRLKFSLPCEYLGMGYGDVSPSADPDAEVWGYLYRIDRLSLSLLDSMEWAIFNQYRRISVEVVGPRDKKVMAQCYISRYPKEGLIPSVRYKNLILESARRHGFPEKYIESIERTPAKTDFPLDPGFSFLRPGGRRFLESPFRGLYLMHDRWREKLANWLRF